MGRIKRKKCCHCGVLFVPDARNAKRQQYCAKAECRKASKAASQRRWLRQPQNQDYFRSPENVARVQQWRKDNPGYWRRSRQKAKGALQDFLITEPWMEYSESQDRLRRDSMTPAFRIPDQSLKIHPGAL